jgi:serine O-acetyltransferase
VVLPRRAVQLFRLADRLYRSEHRSLAWIVATFNRLLTGVDIEPGATIGPGLIIKHGFGLGVGGGVRIGANCRLFQGVTIGLRESRMEEIHAGNWPVIGDDVTIYTNAVVVGGITIGDGATIGANAVVTEDVPAGATVVAPPARRVPSLS